MIVTAVRIKDFKGIISAEFRPGGGLYVIGGENGAGKTSALDAIMVALGGKRFMPPSPVRDGAKQAEIRIELAADPERKLEALTVIRVIGTAGGGSLTVLAAGKKQASPQAILDSLFGHLEKNGAFDPASFVRLDPKTQVKQLKALAGINFDSLDAMRASQYEERAILNKSAQTRKAAIDRIEFDNDAPVKEVCVTDLMEELEKREAVNAEHDHQQKQLTGHCDANRKAWQSVKQQSKAIEDLKQQLVSANGIAKELRAEALADDKRLDGHKAAVLALQNEDVQEVKNRIAKSQEVNAAVRANAELAALTKEHDDDVTASTDCTTAIQEIDDSKTQLLANAEWPVDGLGFDEDGVTYLGRPFSQASGAEQIRVAVAMGIAGDPTLRTLLVRQGEANGDKAMAALAKIAEEKNVQLIMERVGTDHANVVIEEGEVKLRGG